MCKMVVYYNHFKRLLNELLVEGDCESTRFVCKAQLKADRSSRQGHKKYFAFLHALREPDLSKSGLWGVGGGSKL